mmetsp:Transcript_31554/g.92515  ORF Transcript_31554/g.92515 Transcript_31554/m.92515 type:complete len:220 (+) Transcript_31554:760-1419(+)
MESAKSRGMMTVDVALDTQNSTPWSMPSGTAPSSGESQISSVVPHMRTRSPLDASQSHVCPAMSSMSTISIKEQINDPIPAAGSPSPPSPNNPPNKSSRSSISISPPIKSSSSLSMSAPSPPAIKSSTEKSPPSSASRSKSPKSPIMSPSPPLPTPSGISKSSKSMPNCAARASKSGSPLASLGTVIPMLASMSSMADGSTLDMSEGTPVGVSWRLRRR